MCGTLTLPALTNLWSFPAPLRAKSVLLHSRFAFLIETFVLFNKLLFASAAAVLGETTFGTAPEASATATSEITRRSGTTPRTGAKSKNSWASQVFAARVSERKPVIS